MTLTESINQTKLVILKIGIERGNSYRKNDEISR